MEAGGCHTITEIQEEKIRAYLDHLAVRPSRKREGGLSLNYIRKHLQVIRKFARYLTESGQESFGEQIEIEGKTSNIKSILSPEEIGQLYGATGDDLLGLRDRAILGICYGCGLRKNEAISLNTADILLEKDLVLVRKGKGYKARFVPLSGANKTDIEYYLNYGRPYLVNGKKQEAFLVGILGNRFTNIFGRLQQLKAKTAITKSFGPHTLRHSIATHLIESGMELEQVKDFLGHESLESTQIYTHVTA
nr:tyrosine-type recombinase/integrase [Hufsiella ginkgonis]